MGEGAPRLDGVEFGVLALGDTAYAEFCAIGKKIDERLAALGASARSSASIAISISPRRRRVDRRRAERPWRRPTPPRAAASLRSISSKPARRLDRHRRGRDHRACQSEFLALGQGDRASGARLRRRGAGLRAGRLARSLCRERSGLCRRAAGARRAYRRRRAARRTRCKSRDVTTLSLKTLETYAAQTGHHYVKALLADGEARDWIAGRQLIDLIAHLPDRADGRPPARGDAAAGAARLFDRLVRAANSTTKPIC